MSKAEELFHAIAAALPDTVKGKMFGALCIKAPNGKAGVMLWKDFMIFKLPAAEQDKALQLEGAQMFTPMEGRPMNGWVQLSELHSAKWEKLATIALDHVRRIEVAPKKPKAKK